MLIDWFTVAAQVLNFAILAWLMRRFLYRPILNAIDAREQRIASELADASRERANAQRERDEFQKKNDDFEQQRVALLQQAKADADVERQTLLDAARRAADALSAQRQESLETEAKSLGRALRQRAQSEVFAIARKALADMADVGLEASVCAVFIARLQGLDGPSRDALASALSGPRDAVRIRSAFPLPTAQRLALHKVIADTFGIELDLRFEAEPSLVAGIELVAQGQKFAWTVSDHLASLERAVNDLLETDARRPGAAPGPAAAPPTRAAAPSKPANPATAPITAAVAP